MKFHCAVSKRIAHRKQRIQLINSECGSRNRVLENDNLYEGRRTSHSVNECDQPVFKSRLVRHRIRQLLNREVEVGRAAVPISGYGLQA